MACCVVVLGGTGFIGRAFAWRCAAYGPTLQLTVPTRSLARGAELRPLPGLTLAQADVHDEPTLTRLLAGADAVVNLVGILHESGRQTFAAVQAARARSPSRRSR